MKGWFGWIIILLAIASAVMIYFVESFSLPFLIFLVALIVVAVSFKDRFSYFQIRLGQIIIGLLFLFSGFVKGVDPLGTAYRIEDYFNAYGFSSNESLAIILSFLLNGAELLLGGLLVLNIKPRITSWLLLLMMLFFTGVTLYDALYNPVPDCGCFGDAVKMTNWQTFYKNLVINVLVVVVFTGRIRITPAFRNTTEWSLAFLLALLFFGFQYWNVTHLPVLDFRPYKPGNRLYPEELQPVEIYLTYRNKYTGETREYKSPNFPYNDPQWLEEWEFVSMRTIDPNQRVNLAIFDLEGKDITPQIIRNPDYYFIAVAWNLEKSHPGALKKIDLLFREAEKEDISVVILTASEPSVIDSIREQLDFSPHLDFFHADDKELKTMIRANPGLILIHDGKIIRNWHHRQIPSWEVIKHKYLKDRTPIHSLSL